MTDDRTDCPISRAEGVRVGMAFAAAIARAAASNIRLLPRPKEFGEREQKASAGALDALAASIEEALRLRRPPPDTIVTISPPPKGPLSPETSAAIGEMAMAARDYLLAPALVGADARPEPIMMDGAFAQHASQRAASRARGYTGDECRDCGNFTLVRNGTCLKCETCGGTTGCS